MSVKESLPIGEIWINPRCTRSPRFRAIMRDVHYHPWWGLVRVAEKYRLSLSRLYHLFTAGCGQGARKWREEVKDPYIVFVPPGRGLSRSDYEKYGIVETEVPPLSAEKSRELAQRILDSKLSLQPERMKEVIKYFVAENGKHFSWNW